MEKNIYILTYYLKSFEQRHHNAGYYVSAVLFQTVELFQIHEQDLCNVHCLLLRNYHFLDYVRIASSFISNSGVVPDTRTGFM